MRRVAPDQPLLPRDATLACVALGGAVGALGRFGAGGWATTWAGSGFPWPTLLVNVFGSLLLGLLVGALPPRTPAPLRAGLTVGLCGGFTTFSTFDLETLTLLRGGAPALALGYALASVVLCVAGVAGGMRLGAAAGMRAE